MAEHTVGIANAVDLAGVARNAVGLVAVARDAEVDRVPGVAVDRVVNAAGLVDGVVRCAGLAGSTVGSGAGIAVAEGKNAVELAGVAEHAVVGVVGSVDLRTVGGGGNAVEHGGVGGVVDDVEDADELGVW